VTADFHGNCFRHTCTNYMLLCVIGRETSFFDPFPPINGLPAIEGGSLSFAVWLFRITLLTRLTAYPHSTRRLGGERPPFERSLQTRLTAHPHST